MIVIENIGSLVGARREAPAPLRGSAMDSLPIIDRAWLLADETTGCFVDFGTGNPPAGDVTVDARGGMVFPSFCDSHTHIVYAGSREREFIDKIRGLSYEEIAANGGGILNSADRLHDATENELLESARRRLDEMIAKGSGAVEIKSGYGLTTADELKMLRVIARLREESPAVVRSTFLGAHAVGRAYTGRQTDYVNLIIDEMLPAVAAEGLADFVDVFCDRGFFTVDETDRILEAAARYDIRPKIHANELDNSGGVQIGIKHRALSVDHLERAAEAEIEALRMSDTIPTALPGASFFLNMPYAPGRKMIDAGLPLALASDYNPGSSPSGDMRMVVSLACIKMKLTPGEALSAATVNGAYAMGAGNICGSITPGYKANFFITKPMPDVAYLPYAYTSPLITRVFLNGREQ